MQHGGIIYIGKHWLRVFKFSQLLAVRTVVMHNQSMSPGVSTWQKAELSSPVVPVDRGPSVCLPSSLSWELPSVMTATKSVPSGGCKPW